MYRLGTYAAVDKSVTLPDTSLSPFKILAPSYLIWYDSRMNPLNLGVHFYRTDAGVEPVRDWLRSLPHSERKIIGEDLKTVQIGWPLGMPLVRKMDKNLWEVRIILPGKIARILFTVIGEHMVLLHGFIKKSQTTPKDDLQTAWNRLKQIRS